MYWKLEKPLASDTQSMTSSGATGIEIMYKLNYYA